MYKKRTLARSLVPAVDTTPFEVATFLGLGARRVAETVAVAPAFQVAG
jgi:hypothetical protein